MVGELDLFLFHEGTHKEAYELFGSKIQRDLNGNITGTLFRLWAPNAQEVFVVGDFNFWNGSDYRMNKIDKSGVWELFVAEIGEWTLYKYEIHTKNKQVVQKADPYAYYSELRPNSASIVYNVAGYKWNDALWMEEREKINPIESPISIYEVHLGSWQRKADNSFYTYDEIADKLIEYVKKNGYTHIELMPVMEHPLDSSWGYQITGYYSATSRYGTPKNLMHLIDLCHQNNIGVLLDWVPGHFCKDVHGLYNFDGETLYEYPFEDVKENIIWGTANMDLGRGHNKSFLISNALFWMRYFHVDGFRIDAVSNLVYWLGDKNKGNNDKAIEFLQELNTAVFQHFKNAIMIAEDSTEFPYVTEPVYNGGLGFNFKWNLGWMNDTLRYFQKETVYRKYHHNLITFGLIYAFSEKFILPLSHDEVVHGKYSLIEKMPGDYWQKFANYKLLIGLWGTMPGKKLLFMGSEFAQFNEWDENKSLDWCLHEYDAHKGAAKFVKNILQIVKNEKSLHEYDHNPNGFKWINANDVDNSIFTYIRFSKDRSYTVVVVNATPKVHYNYRLGVPENSVLTELINSDDTKYGGTHVCNDKDISVFTGETDGQPYYTNIKIPPLGIVILKPKNS